MNLFRKKTRPVERRSHVRNAIPGNDFEAVLRAEDGTVFLVAIQEISAGGASVRTTPQPSWPLAPGRSANLDLVLSSPGRLIRLQAEIQRVDDRGVHLCFATPDISELHLDAESRMLLTRRRHPRLRLAEHVTVDLTISSIVVSGAIADLSEGGAGIILGSDLAGRLAADDQVDLEFFLPGAVSPTEVSAIVRHRTPYDGSLLFGCEFQPHRPDQLDDVLAYLIRAREDRF